MDDISNFVTDFQNFVNSQSNGYVKAWKANGMILTLRDIPAIMSDKNRLIAFVKNSLMMEGFTDEGCEIIAEWLIQNKDAF